MFIDSNPNNVSWFSSSQKGTPIMLGHSNGDLLKVLDFCLIDGGVPLTANVIEVVEQEVTLTFQDSHGFLVKQYITISGSSSASLNGNHRVIRTTSDSATVIVTGIVSTGGTVTAKVSPLGWQELFTRGTALKRAYRSKSATSSKKIIRLDMTPMAAGISHYDVGVLAAKRAMLSVVSTMSTIDDKSTSLTLATDNGSYTKDDMSPINGSFFWYQKRADLVGTSAPNTPSNWTLIGNDKFFYFIVGWSASAIFDASITGEIYGFGEYEEPDVSGADTTFLMCSHNSGDTTPVVFGKSGGAKMAAAATSNCYAYLFDTGKAVKHNISPLSQSNIAAISGSALTGISLPNKFGDALFTLPCRLSLAKDVVGIMPSMLFIDSAVGVGHHRQIMDDVLLVQVDGTGDGKVVDVGSVGFYLGD